MEFHRQLIHQHHLQSHLQCGNDPTVAKHNGIPSATPPKAPLAMPFALRERSYSCKSPWNSIGNSSTSTTCNPIYNAGTILQLQITMEFCRQLLQKHHLQCHLHCGNDPTEKHHLQCHLHCGNDPIVANHNGIPSATHPPAPLAIPFTMRERSYSCKAQWNSIGNSSTSTTCNPIYNAGTILQLQITMEFHRQLIHQHHLQSHLQCGNDPTVAKHNGIPSASPPKAPLAMPFALRERSYSCKSQWNSIGNSSTSTTCNPIYNAGTILQLQIRMGFYRPHLHEKQLKPDLLCGTDPSIIRA